VLIALAMGRRRPTDGLTRRLAVTLLLGRRSSCTATESVAPFALIGFVVVVVDRGGEWSPWIAHLVIQFSVLHQMLLHRAGTRRPIAMRVEALSSTAIVPLNSSITVDGRRGRTVMSN